SAHAWKIQERIMKLFSSLFWVTLASLTLGACASLGNSAMDGRTESSPFQVQTSNLQRISDREPLYGVTISVTNTSAAAKEFWTSSCSSFMNWWIDNNAVLPVMEETPGCANRPRSVNLQPQASYSEFFTFYVDEKQLKEKDFHVGFSPWETREQLQKRALKMLPADQIKTLTVWSNPILIR
ncbi:MAG: hypothetical protein KDD62_14935, partial [Bdellovibrionales bacterium]|nr:hypothetical protein [Bdellovibrionales bacterium]